MPRKTSGCWTCRARKKKCDEARPACSSCRLRSITFYGYDAKPVWMDGGPTEKNMMGTLQRRIKESYRLRRTRRCKTTAANNDSLCNYDSSSGAATGRSFVESPSPDSSSWTQRSSILMLDRSSQRLQRTTPPYDRDCCLAIRKSHEPRRSNLGLLYSNSTYISNRCSTDPSPPSFAPISFTESELNLIMYYLDHIFPRVAPFFKYSAADNGRGWLLNLFLRIRPLYTAVVCLSACDKAQFLLGPLTDVPQPYHDLEMQHLQSVADLRDHLDQLATKTGASQMAAGVEALVCIIHLIFFELWIPRRGFGVSDWTMHLDAASALLSTLDVASNSIIPGKGNTTPIPASPSEGFDDSIRTDIPVHLLSDSEQSAFTFFLDWYTYVFVCATATFGMTPQSAQAIGRIRAIYQPEKDKLRDLRGCEDWVLLTILEIAVLKDWKQKASQAGTLSLRELNRRAALIERKLQDGAARCARPLRRSSSMPSSTSFSIPNGGTLGTNSTSTPSSSASAGLSRDEEFRMITSTFIHAALVFLHVVVSGYFPNIPEIRNSVLQTLAALEYMRTYSAHNIPSWPYCVAGCLALESEYSRFRALFPPFEEGTHPLVMTMWTLEILEECWKTRASQPGGREICSWVAAMNQLGTRLLLL
ncbi:uncharacterized protein PV06_10331 [Exophiala oligosperma]|uniref:Zn(2)-C6 fungal-type domain-containing protein n=1 Tax=Exophiala oligosperma TaxID=215243 RepID=A0A0D2D312_9EURO|nr:uncharacterized protein PV06_10331 [Exophiala oligosperma]KIW37698.1 hypothetical protein PV06_10331 [Exophiala oligosperma]